MTGWEHLLILWCVVLTVAQLVTMMRLRRHLKEYCRVTLRYIRSYLRDGGTLR